MAQAASAIVLSKHALWFLPPVAGAAIARRVHMLYSYWMFVFAFAHVGLQFSSVLGMLRTRVGRERGTADAGGQLPNARLRVALRLAWALVAVLGAISFVQLGMPGYLTGHVQFAFADAQVPLAVTFARYAAVAVLIAGLFHYASLLLKKKPHGRAAG